MGDLAVDHGFYGAAWEGPDATVYGEAGEALSVSDRDEAWMFHIMADDTGKSAVWAAQRVPGTGEHDNDEEPMHLDGADGRGSCQAP